MRAIVVGAGGISRCWFPALKQRGVEVVAVVDLDAELAGRRVEEHQLVDAQALTDLDEALRTVEADFAVDLTTPGAHEKVTTACLSAGLDVISEKPMAENMDQCRRMVAAAEKSGRLYMVSQSRRYNPLHARVADTVASGRLGRLVEVHCDFFLAAHFGGFRAEMPHVLLNDMAIHHFDMARMFTGTDPVSVVAEEFTPLHSWFRDGPNAYASFTMSGDVRFTYRGSWCAEGCSTGWDGHWRITGSKGTLMYTPDGLSGEVITGEPVEGLQRTTNALEPAPERDVACGWDGALAEFLAALGGGPTPQGECHDNLWSMAMVCGAIESAESDRRVVCTG